MPVKILFSILICVSLESRIVQCSFRVHRSLFRIVQFLLQLFTRHFRNISSFRRFLFSFLFFLLGLSVSFLFRFPVCLFFCFALCFLFSFPICFFFDFAVSLLLGFSLCLLLRLAVCLFFCLALCFFLCFPVRFLFCFAVFFLLFLAVSLFLFLTLLLRFLILLSVDLRTYTLRHLYTVRISVRSVGRAIHRFVGKVKNVRFLFIAHILEGSGFFVIRHALLGVRYIPPSCNQLVRGLFVFCQILDKPAAALLPHTGFLLHVDESLAFLYRTSFHYIALCGIDRIVLLASLFVLRRLVCPLPNELVRLMVLTSLQGVNPVGLGCHESPGSMISPLFGGVSSTQSAAFG